MSGFPAYVLLTTAGQLASFRLQLERFERLSAAVAHGMAIGRSTSCLAAARWEEGWERPVADWRLQLGLADPADGQPYGLSQQFDEELQIPLVRNRLWMPGPIK